MSNLTINLTQAATLIETCGHTNTLLLRGAPGIGKSSILRELARRMPDYHVAYVDVANLDLGDLGMPVIDREAMVTSYAPNARFGVGRGQNKPVLLMLDELGKASKPVLNMLLPVILEQRIGDVQLPVGSIVFGTTNLDSDGVGDNIPAHAQNRMTVARVANPTADEWLAWAGDNGIAPEVMAFAKQFPNAFDCYADLEDGDTNPYIFNPRKGQTKAFCSPRSLEKASNLIKQRQRLGDALLPALAGTIGESGARDMEALIHLADQIPSFEAVCKSPDKTKVPEGVGAYFLMSFMLAGRVTAETLDAVMQYVGRWDNFEAVTLFVTSLATNKSKVGMACRNQAFTKLAASLGRFF
jgi:hypothetical protein